jgi:outer membrane protein TolC
MTVSSANDNLNLLIKEALSNNPEYRAASLQLEATKAVVHQAGALPDPNLGVAVLNLPVDNYRFDQEPMTGKRLSLMQKIPFPGKLGLRKKNAHIDVAIAKERIVDLKNNLMRRVKTAYFDLLLIDRSIEIIERNSSLADQIIEVAESKYAIGEGIRQDVLKAYIERSKIQERIISFVQNREKTVFMLNRLLNRESASLIQDEAEIHHVDIEIGLGELKEQGLSHNPRLKIARMLIDQAHNRYNLAKLNYAPDFSLGVAYTQREDLASGLRMDDFLSFELNIRLPIYFLKKQSKKVQESRLNIESFWEKYESIKNQMNFEIEYAYSEITKINSMIELYESEIIPRARQSLNSSIGAYRVNKIDFLTLIDNQMTLLNYELEFIRLVTEHAKEVARLEAAVGKRLNSKYIENRKEERNE